VVATMTVKQAAITVTKRKIEMKKFIAGFFAGIAMTVAVSAFAAKMVGSEGFLMGWEVTKDGEEICSDPYVWASIREIDCN